ncbi:hypothetical protein LTR02_003882 [Friedmanniomyces endolithicus]|nr:hypothetical protein LTR02_003882 [Friedmanniomyces endolithicus]
MASQRYQTWALQQGLANPRRAGQLTLLALQSYAESFACHRRYDELELRTPVNDKAYCVYLSVIPEPQCARIEIELCMIPALEQRDTDHIYLERYAKERMTASFLAQDDSGPVYTRRPFDFQARPAKNDPPTGCHNFSRQLYAVQFRPVEEAEAAVGRSLRFDIPKGQVVFSWKGTAFSKLAINRHATRIAAAAGRTFRAILQAMESGGELYVVPHKNGGGLRVLDTYGPYFASLWSPSLAQSWEYSQSDYGSSLCCGIEPIDPVANVRQTKPVGDCTPNPNRPHILYDGENWFVPWDEFTGCERKAKYKRLPRDGVDDDEYAESNGAAFTDREWDIFPDLEVTPKPDPASAFFAEQAAEQSVALDTADESAEIANPDQPDPVSAFFAEQSVALDTADKPAETADSDQTDLEGPRRSARLESQEDVPVTFYPSQKDIKLWEPGVDLPNNFFPIANSQHWQLTREPWTATSSEIFLLVERGLLSGAKLSMCRPQAFGTHQKVHDAREPFGRPAIMWNPKETFWCYVNFHTRVILYGGWEFEVAKKKNPDKNAVWLDLSRFKSAKAYEDAHTGKTKERSKLYMTNIRTSASKTERLSHSGVSTSVSQPQF